MEKAPSQTDTAPDRARAILARHGQAVGEYLAALRHRWADSPTQLLDAMDYSIKAGGKRLRPSLVLECAEVARSALIARGSDLGVQDSGKNGDRPLPPKRCATSAAQHSAFDAVLVEPDPQGRRQSSSVRTQPSTPLSPKHPAFTLHPSSSALAAAAAIELIHTFSLVHDDLPAMDNDDLRRGRPTNHKVFGDAMAILAGDAMVTAAFEVLAADADPRQVPALVRELASASGPEGMIGGQVLDMDGERRDLNFDELQRVHRMKTGALLSCACRLGAIAEGGGDSPLLESLTAYGRHLGLAFQIVDDVLDVTSTPEQLGKATNKDADRGKNTYPRLLGLESSREEAARQLAAALGSLEGLGERADGLRDLRALSGSGQFEP